MTSPSTNPSAGAEPSRRGRNRAAPAIRIGCDTGGTFTDVAIHDGRSFKFFKAPTTPARPVEGILHALELAAADAGASLPEFLRRADVLVHGTTHPLNALLTGRGARTALIVTKGHRDVLMLREGGRADPFDKERVYPRPFVPRELTFELDERILWDGQVDRAPSDDDLRRLAEAIAQSGAQAVAVCLLWSIRNPAHEQAVKHALARRNPLLEISLSSDVNPIIREFRRASATAIDASLKGFVKTYLGDLGAELRRAGLDAPLLVVASDGGLMTPEQAASLPISLINSGPSMAPMAARVLVSQDQPYGRDLIVSDTGGTTFDVCVVRGSALPVSTESWVGAPSQGLFCGFPSLAVQSVGAGGGSIAWVDPDGLLHVGPDSAGADPGPACFGRGGVRPTFTDAAVVRGIVDPARFLGGRLPIDPVLARAAVQTHVANPLGLSADAAAVRIMALGSQRMIQTIEEAVARQGMNPAKASFVGGGGAAGFNVVALAERLNCPRVLFPLCGPVLSAFGMIAAPPAAEARRTLPTTSRAFDGPAIADVVAGLRASALARLPSQLADGHPIHQQTFTEARYEGQVWEIEVELADDGAQLSLDEITRRFHARHQELFSFHDERSPIEFLSWRVRLTVESSLPPTADASEHRHHASVRRTVMLEHGFAELPVFEWDMGHATKSTGPAIVESAYATILIERPYGFEILPSGDMEVSLER